MPSLPAVPDGKRPTLTDLAARAGVSVSLASIVMRGAKGAGAATRERVLEAAREIGYRPDSRARLLRSSRSHLLGVQFDLQQPFHADMVEALYTAAESAGYQIAPAVLEMLRELVDDLVLARRREAQRRQAWTHVGCPIRHVRPPWCGCLYLS